MLFDGIGKKALEKYLTRKKLTVLTVCAFGFVVFADWATISQEELQSADKGGSNENSDVESSYSVDENGSVTEIDETEVPQGSTSSGETVVIEYENGSGIKITKVE